MQPILNPQIENLQESATLFINQQALQLRNEGQDICHMGFGESPFPVPYVMQVALQENAHHKQYLSGYGLQDLREAVAKFYQDKFAYDYSAKNVFIGPGSKELIFQMLYLLEGPLMVPAPSWVSYGPQAHIRSKVFHPIHTERSNGYRLQADELEQACAKQEFPQKILIFNNPSNPTGSVHSEDEIKELAEVCRKNNVIVIADEIYALVNFSGQEFTGMAKYYPEGTIVTSGISKAHSAGGWRLGFAMIPEALQQMVRPLSALVSETFSCVSAPIQFASIPGFEPYDGVKEHIEKCRDIHATAGRYLHQRFTEIGLNCPEPKGAFYLFPDFENFKEKLNSRGINTSQQLTQRLLDSFGVAMLPGSAFYMQEEFLGVRVASVDYDGADVLENFPGIQEMTPEWNAKLFPKLVEAGDRIEEWLK